MIVGCLPGRMAIACAVFAFAAACAGGPTVPSSELGARTRGFAPGFPAVVFVSDLKTNTIWELDPSNFTAPPFGKITSGIGMPGALAIGPDGTLYAATRIQNTSFVRAYHRGEVRPFRSVNIGNSNPTVLAVATDNTLVVGINQFVDIKVLIFDKGSATPTRVYKATREGQAAVEIAGVAIDATDNIYMSIGRYPQSLDPILKLPPGSLKPVKTQIAATGVITGFDSAGNLYDGFGNQINVYPQGQSQPSRIITNGLQTAGLFAVLPDGTLYVPNYAIGLDGPGNVVQYAPGGSTPIAVNATQADAYAVAVAYRAAIP